MTDVAIKPKAKRAKRSARATRKKATKKQMEALGSPVALDDIQIAKRLTVVALSAWDDKKAAMDRWLINAFDSGQISSQQLKFFRKAYELETRP